MLKRTMIGVHRFLFFASLVCFAFVIVSGCSNGAESANPTSEAKSPTAFDPKESVSLKFGLSGAALSDDEFQDLIVKPVQKVYPNVSMELVRMTAEDEANLVATNQYPDLYYTNASGIYNHKDLQVVADIMPLVKRERIDLGQFDPSSIEFISNASGDGKMYLMPLWLVADGTFYNKDIFDKFGVSYPKDNMIWDEVFELAGKVSRMDSGVQYIGVTTSSISNMKNGLVLPFADASTKKGLLESDSWKLLFESYVKMQKIPGNYSHGQNGNNLFENDRVVAMYPNFTGRVGELEKLYDQGKPMNFDIATYPSFGNSKYAATTNVSGISFNIKSTKQDWAFRVVQVLEKKENQLEAARNGRVSALKDKDIQRQYAANLGAFKDKHVEGFFTKPTNIPGLNTKYDSFGNKRMNEAIEKVLVGSEDINTALREANELLNQDIAANP